MKRILVGVIVLGALGIASPSGAVDFSSPILDFKGKPIPDCPPAKPDCGDALTLGALATTSLLAQTPDDRNVTSAEKEQRFKLGLRINSQTGDIKLSAEDTALLKTLISKSFNALAAGRANELLDPEAK